MKVLQLEPLPSLCHYQVYSDWERENSCNSSTKNLFTQKLTTYNNPVKDL